MKFYLNKQFFPIHYPVEQTASESPVSRPSGNSAQMNKHPKFPTNDRFPGPGTFNANSRKISGKSEPRGHLNFNQILLYLFFSAIVFIDKDKRAGE